MPLPSRLQPLAERAGCIDRQVAMQRISPVAALACLLGLPLGVALSQTPPAERPSPGVWPEREYRWYYNPQIPPPWLEAGAARELVLEAAARWEACGVRMTFLGDTDRPPGQMDRRNVVGWSVEMPAHLRAITMGQARDGRLLERDIAIRPDRKEFEQAPVLLRKVITHEFGHAIGLTHSSRCDDVMTLAADCPRVRPESLPLDPTANDMARCRAIYLPPGQAKAGSPVVDTQAD